MVSLPVIPRILEALANEHQINCKKTKISLLRAKMEAAQGGTLTKGLLCTSTPQKCPPGDQICAPVEGLEQMLPGGGGVEKP